jgi:hypothetical protein
MLLSEKLKQDSDSGDFGKELSCFCASGLAAIIAKHNELQQ